MAMFRASSPSELWFWVSWRCQSLDGANPQEDNKKTITWWSTKKIMNLHECTIGIIGNMYTKWPITCLEGIWPKWPIYAHFRTTIEFSNRRLLLFPIVQRIIAIVSCTSCRRVLIQPPVVSKWRCLKIRHAPINFHCEHGKLWEVSHSIPSFRPANAKGPSTCQAPIGKLGKPLCFSLSCPLSGLGSSGIIWDAANMAVLATTMVIHQIVSDRYIYI